MQPLILSNQALMQELNYMKMAGTQQLYDVLHYQVHEIFLRPPYEPMGVVAAEVVEVEVEVEGEGEGDLHCAIGLVKSHSQLHRRCQMKN